MSQLLKTARDIIDALHNQQDKPPLEVLEDLEAIQEHIEIAIDAVQDTICSEE